MIVKLHGTVSQFESILTTVKDIFRAKESFHLSLLKRQIASRPLVVVGYSGSDFLDVMPCLLSADIQQLIWIVHVPLGSSPSKSVDSMLTPSNRYLSLLSRRPSVQILVADTEMVFEQAADILGIHFRPTSGYRKKPLNVPGLVSMVQSHPAQNWELLDRFRVLDRFPVDKIMLYLRSKDPFVDQVYSPGAFSDWRIYYGLVDKAVTRHIAETYRAYGLALLRHRELDQNLYYCENALLKAQEMLQFIGDEQAYRDIQLNRIELEFMRGELVSFDNAESALERQGHQQLLVKATCKKAELELRRGSTNEAFGILVNCTDRVNKVDDVEILTLYEGLVVAVVSHIQAEFAALWAFEKVWDWNNWSAHFIECAGRYLIHVASGVPVPSCIDHDSTLAAIARLLLQNFGTVARDYLWSNDAFYLSGFQSEIEAYLDKMESNGITKSEFERALSACRNLRF